MRVNHRCPDISITGKTDPANNPFKRKYVGCDVKGCFETVDVPYLATSSCSTIININKKFLDSVSPDEYVPIRPVTSSVRGKLVPVAVPQKKFSHSNFRGG
jgi:hypothetical protein